MNDNIIDARARFQALQDRSGHVVLQSVSKPEADASVADATAVMMNQIALRGWLDSRPPMPRAPMPPVRTDAEAKLAFELANDRLVRAMLDAGSLRIADEDDGA